MYYSLVAALSSAFLQCMLPAGGLACRITVRCNDSTLDGAVEQTNEPSKEYVDQIHAQVVTAVQELYNKHRHILPGWDTRDLTII